MNNDLISRSALLKKRTRMTEYDETGCGVHVFVVMWQWRSLRKWLVHHVKTANVADIVNTFNRVHTTSGFAMTA